MRTAKAKGLPGRVVTFKHALRNALLPVVTNIGLEIPFLFTGAIVTETIFSWPGIGKLTIDATRKFDYPVLMGVLLITADRSWCSRTCSPTSPTPSSIRASSTEVGQWRRTSSSRPVPSTSAEVIDRRARGGRARGLRGRPRVAQPVAARLAQVPASTRLAIIGLGILVRADPGRDRSGPFLLPFSFDRHPRAGRDRLPGPGPVARRTRSARPAASSGTS